MCKGGNIGIILLDRNFSFNVKQNVVHSVQGGIHERNSSVEKRDSIGLPLFFFNITLSGQRAIQHMCETAEVFSEVGSSHQLKVSRCHFHR